MNAALLICRMAKWPENAPYERIRIKVSSQQLKMSVVTLLRWRNRVLSVSQRLKGNLAERQGHCQDSKCQTTWTACIFQIMKKQRALQDLIFQQQSDKPRPLWRSLLWLDVIDEVCVMYKTLFKSFAFTDMRFCKRIVASIFLDWRLWQSK